MPNKKVLLNSALFAENGIVANIGELSGGAQDGLDFIFLAKSEEQDEPILILRREYAILALKSIAQAILLVSSDRDEFNQFVQDKLALISTSIDEIAEACE